MPTQCVCHQVTVDKKSRVEMTPTRKEACGSYPDPQNYWNQTKKYFFRANRLEHLRVAQCYRYYPFRGDANQEVAESTRMDENLIDEGDDGVFDDNPHDRNYDAPSAATYFRARPCSAQAHGACTLPHRGGVAAEISVCLGEYS